jgi:hypothetical protein
MSRVQTIHEYRELAKIDVWYPAHPPRKPTALYTRTHKALCITEDQPCYICGVRRSTLKSRRANPWGAKAMETHHWIIEDSLAEAIDLGKFNRRIVAWFRKHAPGNADYKRDFTQREMVAWIHGHRDNMRVLCDKHHRSAHVGVHHLPYPFWGVQDLLRSDFKFTLETPVRYELTP